MTDDQKWRDAHRVPSYRCVHCHRIIWFWQRRGWFVRHDGTQTRWHGKCARAVLEADLAFREALIHAMREVMPKVGPVIEGMGYDYSALLLANAIIAAMTKEQPDDR